MRLIATAIPANSHEIAVWNDLPPSSEDSGEPIDLVCNLHHVSSQECRVTKAKGDLTDRTNIEIGLYAHSLGYKVMRFCVAHGSPASHWAIFEYTENNMDFYRVELDEAVAIYRSLQ